MNIFSGNIVDVLNSEIYPGKIYISNARIINIERQCTTYDIYIIPGFVDSHIHIESSMLVPSEFARIAVIHGTIAVVSDPHEIANVLGIEGIKYMIENSSKVPLKFFFGVPSCVPATQFESSGASLGLSEIETLLKSNKIKFLAEMMNFPAVINNDKFIHEIILLAKKYRKPIDGHAPGLKGIELQKYINAGISTDHETINLEEGREKILRGMKVLIREGSAAKNFDKLIPLLDEYPESCMFCSDDKHPDDLINGHINKMVKRAVKLGIDYFKVLKAASVNPILHYGLNVGLLRTGDSADFLLVDNLKDFNIIKTIISGEVVAESGKTNISRKRIKIVNNFNIREKNSDDFLVLAKSDRIRIIEAYDGQIITGKTIDKPLIEKGQVIADPKRNILKITVVNRYSETKPAIGFIKNFGLMQGAIASSVAHDSHNIIAIGTTDEELCRAVNLLIKHQGGICAVSSQKEVILPLPVAGIMSDEEYNLVAQKYTELVHMAKELGSSFHSPFMTLSFMSLLVIPKLKLSDKGLFDTENFKLIDLFV